MSKTSELTQERLKELLHYDPETGLFTWIKRPSNRVKVGDIAGKPGPIGYVRIGISGVVYFAHRLVFLYMDGDFPEEVDHINGVRDDNRWSNLRRATKAENRRNVGKKIVNTSGFKGVSFVERLGKYQARIWFHKTIHLGLYDTPEEAHAAYCEAADRLHGDFSNHG